MVAHESFAPDAYLIDRRADDAGEPRRGFTLIPIRRDGPVLVTAEGLRIDVSDEQRFLYPGDMDRAVDRGIASRGPAGISGPRFSALAVFPLLRPRHLPDHHVPGPDEACAPGTQTTEVESDLVRTRATNIRRTARPTIPTANKEAQPRRRRPTRPAADDPGPTKEVDDPSAQLPDVRPDSPSGEAEEGPGTAVEPSTPLERALGALDQSQLPADADVDALAEDRAALQQLLDAAGQLKHEPQLRIAELVATVLMRHPDARDFLHVWLRTTADRLHGRANLLAQLLETWSCADATAALAALRDAQRSGAISIDQRSPIVVADLMRELARDVGDSDALREAYDALARAPERRGSSGALLRLVADVREEEVGTDGERRAIGLPILLQAFAHAGSAELGSVAIEAETYARAFVRSDPPNVESALRLRPALERAHAAADQSGRSQLEDVLREIDAAAGEERAATGRTDVVTVSSPVKALDAVLALSPNVDVLVSARDSARKWGKDGLDYVDELMEALRAVAGVADRYALNEVGKDGFVAAFAEHGQVLVPRESESTGNNRKARRAHVVQDDLGRPVVLGPHLKFGKRYRLYLAFDESRRRIQIGWVGEHLRTGTSSGGSR